LRAPLAVEELEAGAAFHAAEHADQSLEDWPLSLDLIDELVLGMGTLKEVILGACLLGQALAWSTTISDCFSAKAMKSQLDRPEHRWRFC
jgi:hypothetical protein